MRSIVKAFSTVHGGGETCTHCQDWCATIAAPTRQGRAALICHAAYDSPNMVDAEILAYGALAWLARLDD